MEIIKMPFPPELKDLLKIRIEVTEEMVKAVAQAQPAKDTPESK